jgi:hypothetical protein
VIAELTVKAAPSGVAIVYWPIDGRRRHITGAAVVSTSALPSTALVIVASNVAAGTSTGNADVATFAPPVEVPGNAPVVVRWAGCTPGAQCTATLQYEFG